MLRGFTTNRNQNILHLINLIYFTLKTKLHLYTCVEVFRGYVAPTVYMCRSKTP